MTYHFNGAPQLCGVPLTQVLRGLDRSVALRPQKIELTCVRGTRRLQAPIHSGGRRVARVGPRLLQLPLLARPRHLRTHVGQLRGMCVARRVERRTRLRAHARYLSLHAVVVLLHLVERALQAVALGDQSRHAKLERVMRVFDRLAPRAL
jgi:hypothetical protein